MFGHCYYQYLSIVKILYLSQTLLHLFAGGVAMLSSESTNASVKDFKCSCLTLVASPSKLCRLFLNWNDLAQWCGFGGWSLPLVKWQVARTWTTMPTWTWLSASPRSKRCRYDEVAKPDTFFRSKVSLLPVGAWTSHKNQHICSAATKTSQMFILW